MACCVLIASLFAAVIAIKAKYLGLGSTKGKKALEWRLERYKQDA